MIALPDFQFFTPEEYLELETQSPIKHEYIDGEIYAMAGTTDAHNTIAGNLFVLIRNHLRGTNCRAYFADLKVRLEKLNRFYYPDLLVTCNPQDQETPTYKQFPKLIVEILSDSTEAFDRGNKFHDYQTIESLEEYILVNTKYQRVEIFRRSPQTGWLFQTYTPTNATFFLHSLDLVISFTDLYEDIDFTQENKNQDENQASLDT
jgi:Uma2 family endonuclease